MRIPLTSQEKKVVGFIALLALLGLAVLTAKRWWKRGFSGAAQAPPGTAGPRSLKEEDRK